MYDYTKLINYIISNNFVLKVFCFMYYISNEGCYTPSVRIYTPSSSENKWILIIT